LLPAVRPVTCIALLALVALASPGCHARPAQGESCRVADQLVCAGRDSALVCESTPPGVPSAASPQPPATTAQSTTQVPPPRTWMPVPCRGAKGCARAGGEDDCDDTMASIGDSCPRNPPLDYACSTDLATALVCKDGRYDLWRRCRGRNVRCDTSLGEPDDPCEHTGTFACSVDGTTMLQCDGKSLVAASSCRGPKACSFEKGEPGADPHKIDCDDGIAMEGDPCTQPRRITCAPDHKEELVCDGHKFGKKRDCRRSDCRIEGTELSCD
jgi:hypothetical protein